MPLQINDLFSDTSGSGDEKPDAGARDAGLARASSQEAAGVDSLDGHNSGTAVGVDLDVAHLTRLAGWALTPAGVHGLACGALIGDPGLDARRLALRFGQTSPLGGQSVDETIASGIEGLRLMVLRALHDPEIRFRPELGVPHEHHPTVEPDVHIGDPGAEGVESSDIEASTTMSALADRVVALADWVEGLLAGLGETPGLAQRQNPAIDEILRDFASIARLDRDTWTDLCSQSGAERLGVEFEDSAGDFEELYEFVRVASVYLFELLQAENDFGAYHDAAPLAK